MKSLSQPADRWGIGSPFLAIDFETADYGPDSACAVGLVRVEAGRIVQRAAFLIRPPRRTFVFTYLHGISWSAVKDRPTFGELWPSLREHFSGIEFMAAHNARFDRAVLAACCQGAGVEPPAVPFECTMRWARRLWGIRPTRLPDVCRHFGIPLNHHRAESDTEACAEIMIRALGSASLAGSGSAAWDVGRPG